jgi:hypothetical protein
MGVSTATEMKQIGKIENGVHSLVVGWRHRSARNSAGRIKMASLLGCSLQWSRPPKQKSPAKVSRHRTVPRLSCARVRVSQTSILTCKPSPSLYSQWRVGPGEPWVDVVSESGGKRPREV